MCGSTMSVLRMEPAQTPDLVWFTHGATPERFLPSLSCSCWEASSLCAHLTGWFGSREHRPQTTSGFLPAGPPLLQGSSPCPRLSQASPPKSLQAPGHPWRASSSLLKAGRSSGEGLNSVYWDLGADGPPRGPACTEPEPPRSWEGHRWMTNHAVLETRFSAVPQHLALPSPSRTVCDFS